MPTVSTDAEREAELRMHTAEVSNVLAAWDAARSRIDLYENERLPLARQRSQAALAGFGAGTVDMTALLASHVAEIEVKRSYAELMRELGLAWVFLRYSTPGRSLYEHQSNLAGCPCLSRSRHRRFGILDRLRCSPNASRDLRGAHGG